MGYLFLEADTTAGEKKIAVYDWWHNFRVIHGKMLAVTDADGNRYSVPDVDRLDKASIKSSSCSSDTAFIAFAERSGYK